MRINIRRQMLVSCPVPVACLQAQETVSLGDNPDFTMDVDYNNDFSFKAKFSIPQSCMGGGAFGFCEDDTNNSEYRLSGYNGEWFFDIHGEESRVYFGICNADKVYELEVGNSYVKDIKNGMLS